VEREVYKGQSCLIGYHTQEYRTTGTLEAPLKCKAKYAWLGIGYYFWTELEFAKYWGEDAKKSTGYYDIYKALLKTDQCINAVFDEEGYFFFRKKIEETIDYFVKNGQPAILERVNRFLADNIWPALGVEGIIYDDKPTNPKQSDRIYSEIPDLYYKKRIQVVLFNLANIYNFELFLEEQE
jgi:hypothetical protein